MSKGVVYSVSDVGNMVSDLRISIDSVRKHSPNWKIYVCMTPPFPKENIIRKIANKTHYINLRDNLTEKVNIGDRLGRFCEKLTVIAESPYEETVFLDCDTRNRYSLSLLNLDGCKYSARVAPSNLYSEWNNYVSLFKEYDRVIPITNAGFMVFSNGSANYIGEKALEKSEYLIKNKHLMAFNPQKQYDQISISLALAELGVSVKYMTKREHSFRWLHEKNTAIINHGDNKGSLRELYRSLRGWYYYVS